MYQQIVSLATLALLVACGSGGGGSGSSNSSSTNSPTPVEASDWLIPENQIVDGGPGRDGIPAIDNPMFVQIPIGQPIGLPANLVVGYKSAGEAKAIPHDILDWHEVVNDTLQGEPVVVNYCPLTGSAMLWRSSMSDPDPRFGVSGLVYNSNLILFDRQTGSHWSQMRVQSVQGPRRGEVPERLPLVETTLETWHEMYPNSFVMTRDTGFSRNYNIYPYGSFRTSDGLFFNVEPRDLRLQEKTRVLGVRMNGVARAYVIDEFDAGIEVINDTLGGVPIVVAGSAGANIAVTFRSTLADGTVLDFAPSADPLPTIMVDNEGNTWDVFGEALTGTRSTEKLALADSYIAYWFAWAAFNADSEIDGR